MKVFFWIVCLFTLLYIIESHDFLKMTEECLQNHGYTYDYLHVLKEARLSGDMAILRTLGCLLQCTMEQHTKVVNGQIDISRYLFYVDEIISTYGGDKKVVTKKLEECVAVYSRIANDESDKCMAALRFEECMIMLIE